MGYLQNNNPFKRKTSSPLFKKSPLRQQANDPNNETVNITSDVTTGEGGNTVQTMTRERINVVDPSRNVENIETDDQKFLESFNNEFKKAQEGGFEGTLLEYIKQKEEDAGYRGKEEKVIEERVITKTETPTEKVEEVERPKTFFEDFKNHYNFPSYERGDDRRIKVDGNEGWSLYNQPVVGKSGNTYNKINFNDERTKKWLESEEGQNVMQGGQEMMNAIEGAMKNKIIEFYRNQGYYGDIPETKMITEINTNLNKYFGLGNDEYGSNSSDSKLYGLNSSSEKWLQQFINNPDKLQETLIRLKLTGPGGTTTDKNTTQSSSSTHDDTGWLIKN